MKKQICIFFLLSAFFQTVFSRDYEFIWQLNSSLAGYSYTIKIEKENSKSLIKFYIENPKDSCFANVKNTDCDSLFNFLSNYLFKSKGGSKILEIVKDYQDVISLNDSNWIFLKGDSLRLEIAILKGLMFDKLTNKYYYEQFRMIDWTDGITFTGKLKTNDIYKEYKIHSGRISEEDYTLNKIIVSLVKKYISNHYISKFIELSEGAKPVKKEFQ